MKLEVVNRTSILGNEIEVYGDFNNPLFLAKDVANWIEHSNVTDMISRVDEDEVTKLNLGGKKGECNFLTEDGLYEVLMQSRKPIAKEFKKKIKTMLKELRKGNIQITKTDEQQKAELLLSIYNGGQDGVLASKKLVELETLPLINKIEEDKPLVGFAETCIKSKDSILVRELAKIASDEGIVIGQNKLYDKLREWNYILKSSTEPTQYAIDRGYFEVIQ